MEDSSKVRSLIPIPERYSINNLRRVIHEPTLLEEELRRLLTTVFTPVNNLKFRIRYGDGIDVPEKDWDNLIILDACRYDVFEEVNDLDGELDRVVSAGSWSWEFMSENFVGRVLHDTVYITSNPFVERLDENVFYTVENLLHEWNPESGTISPQTVVDGALKAHEEYPDKKLIIHFMQPHAPWIGPTASRIQDRIGRFQGWSKNRHQQEESGSDLPGMGEWEAVQGGHISQDELNRAYRESLEIVLDHVDGLLGGLDGKSVVTSDHGEMFGKQIAPFTTPLYGHHHHELNTPELCLVPWLEIESNSRREIASERPVGFKSQTEEEVAEQLRALGYADEV